MSAANDQASEQPDGDNTRIGLDAILNSLGNEGVQTILEALNSGKQGTSIVKALLKNAPLAAEQQPMIDLLLSLADSQQQQGTLIEGDLEADELEEFKDEEEHPGNVYELRQFRRELIDLRKVNDTVAAALGACPVCWGGDSHCHECDGEGETGAYEPDLRLFAELVVPAVRRIRTMKRARLKCLARERR